MKKLSVCVLFGGISSGYDASLCSAEFVLGCLDPEKYNVFPVGITRNEDWILYTGGDYSLISTGEWQNHEGNRRAAISPVRGQGLLSFEGDCVVREWIDVVFPVFQEEDGAVRGLLQTAGIPFVGPRAAAFAVSMDKTLTKLVADQAGVNQAEWMLVRNCDLDNHLDAVLDSVEEKFNYPVIVKPARIGASEGVSKAEDRIALKDALLKAGTYDKKVLVEEFIHGREVEVAIMGNDNPVASDCGEIVYDTDLPVAYIPARIPEDVEEQIRETAVKIYSAIGCQGLSRVDFFITYEDNRVVFNGINTMPDFTSNSLYPKLFAAGGFESSQLIDELLRFAMEALK